MSGRNTVLTLYFFKEINLFSKIKFYDYVSVDSRQLKIFPCLLATYALKFGGKCRITIEQKCASLNVQCDVQESMTS